MGKHLLDICSGTGSVSKVAREMGWTTTTLDNDPKTNPDILMNVLDYVPSGNWDFVWCSPPCTEYSIALTTRKRDLLTADKISQKCLEIIEHLSNKGIPCAMENPWTGHLKRRPHMVNLTPKVVTYCKYGFPYMKNSIMDMEFGLDSSPHL